MKTKHVLMVTATSVLVVMALLYVAISPKSSESSANAARSVDARAALERMSAVTIGAPAAKVHIVEFLDPACETCRDFYPLVKKIMADNPDRIRLSVRLIAFHNGSDFVVRLLYAARKQDQFWPVLTRLLATQQAWAINHTVQPDLVWQQVTSLGLDDQQLRKDMESPEVAAAATQDMQDAKALKVTQTPEFFVNGQGLPTFGYEQLQGLVADALARAYP